MQTLDFHGVTGNGIPVMRVDNATFLQFGTTVPTDGATGYAKGCFFIKTNGSAGGILYINEGTSASCDFNLALSDEVSAMLDGVTAGTWAASKACTLNSSGDATLVDGTDLALGTSTGTKIGTAVSQKLGFWNATPVVQPSGAAQAALTNSTGGTADATLSAVGATDSGDVSGTINDNFTELHTLLNAIRTALVNAGIIKGAA